MLQTIVLVLLVLATTIWFYTLLKHRHDPNPNQTLGYNGMAPAVQIAFLAIATLVGLIGTIGIYQRIGSLDNWRLLLNGSGWGQLIFVLMLILGPIYLIKTLLRK